MSEDLNRRGFLVKGSAGVAALGAFNVLGANDRVRVAICGIHARGNDHLENYARLQNVQIAALCDVDESVLAKRVAQMDKMGLPKPVTYTDVRKLLEDKSIDAVSIATPNHWHSLMTIWACQAGKDVYVEKPMSHNVMEGRRVMEAAGKYKRIVQHGTQGRSATTIREAVQKIRDGIIGETYMGRGVCYKWRDTIGRASEEPVPA